MSDDAATFWAKHIDDAFLCELTKHAPKPSDNDTLTEDKMRRVIRCRLRYAAGYGMPGEDLYVLKATPREVLGVLWQEGMREPTVEGPIGPPIDWTVGIISRNYNVT